MEGGPEGPASHFTYDAERQGDLLIRRWERVAVAPGEGATLNGIITTNRDRGLREVTDSSYGSAHAKRL